MESLPWVGTGVLIMGAVGVVVERVTGLAGPATKVANWWHDRHLRKLRRKARYRAELRRIEQEEESARITELRAEVEWLRGEVRRLRSELAAARADTGPHTAVSRNLPRVPAQRR